MANLQRAFHGKTIPIQEYQENDLDVRKYQSTSEYKDMEQVSNYNDYSEAIAQSHRMLSSKQLADMFTS